MKNGFDLPNPLLTANNFQAACDVCALSLTRKPGTVWLVYSQCISEGGIPALEEKLDTLGFSFTFRQFYGWENLVVYGVRRPGGGSDGPQDCMSEEERTRCEQELNSLGLGELDVPSREKAIACIQRLLPDEPPYNYEILDYWQRVFFLLRICWKKVTSRGRALRSANRSSSTRPIVRFLLQS
jgi:hypothetical protein